MASAGVDITPWAAISAKSVIFTSSASRPRLASAAWVFSPRVTHFLQPEPRILMIMEFLPG
ncbi:hypothetical protein D3C78_1797650 [compost metagenome]